MTQARRKVGDIIEFQDGQYTLVDRVHAVHISSKCGTQYYLDQYDGCIGDKEIIRLIEAGPNPGELHTTWPSKYRSGQVIKYKYNGREDQGEVDEVDWRFSKDGGKELTYWLTCGHQVYEKDVICELDTRSMNSPQTNSEPPCGSISAKDVPASERGPRLVKSTE